MIQASLGYIVRPCLRTKGGTKEIALTAKACEPKDLSSSSRTNLKISDMVVCLKARQIPGPNWGAPD